MLLVPGISRYRQRNKEHKYMKELTIKGKYTEAICRLTENAETAIDPYAVAQLERLCNNETLAGCRVRIMPDVHPGKVGTIGFTMTVGDKLLPNLVGVDIGCGMTMVKVKTGKIEFQKLDKVIREQIPSGSSVKPGDILKKLPILTDPALTLSPARIFAMSCEKDLHCGKHIDAGRAYLSLGTLGSGNHFIEIDKDPDEKGFYYITVHSGSRYLGKAVTEYYLTEGQKRLKASGIELPYEETYLTGALLTNYLSDLQFVQDFADQNRKAMLEVILKEMKWKALEWTVCRHNYVDFTPETVSVLGSPVLRKGAISAKEGEHVIIPINMRDGILLGTGKGNTDWNLSAPHGAGRILKREDVKSRYTTSQYKKSMEGIYSPSVGPSTLDEAPFAYRSLDEIREAIGDTVTIDKILKPVYNFKAGGED